MATLVFDIETVGEPWDQLDETTRAVLLRWSDRVAKTPAERAAMEKDVQEGLGFSPLTGFVVAVGVYDVEREKGVVYYSSDGEITYEDEERDGFLYKCRSEEEILSEFWEGAKNYDTFVTFNGRGFDVPFLVHRSAIKEVRPSVDLMQGRYLYQQKGIKHIDLQDQLTFYGAMLRRPSLHLFCRAYGIESPKVAGVAGDDVAELFHQKKFRDIAHYNARDVVATAELYKKWQQYLQC